MILHVSVQLTWSVKFFSTFWTRKFLFIMKSDVPSQFIFIFKTSFVRAHLTLKLSLLTVSSLVFLILFLSKCFITNRRNITFLTCMCSITIMKFWFTLKTLLAYFKLESLFMYPRVIIKTIYTIINKLNLNKMTYVSFNL